jgi:hypothetical protein
MVARKALWLLIPAVAAALTASQWQDIARYMKIKQMSHGNGHPQNVPAGGRTAYPQPSNEGDGGGGRGKSQRPAGGSTARDRTGIDPQEPINDSSPNFQRG